MIKNKIKKSLILPLFFLITFSLVYASTVDGTIDMTNKYVWGQNTGWLNFGNINANVHITDSALSGYIWSPNYGWINLSPTRSGVKNDGSGNLSGYAWGGNLGWIDFSNVKINTSGIFTGTASGSLSGTINFNCVHCLVQTDWRPASVRNQNNNPPPAGGGGGGGGGGAPTLQSAVIIRGLAYPESIISILKNGKIISEVPANPDGTFETTIQTLPPGTYSFAVLAEDPEHLKSSLDLYTVFVSAGVTTLLDGLFIPPTITTDKIEVKVGDPIIFMGRSAPNAKVILSTHSQKEVLKNVKSSKSGTWLYKLDSSELENGNHESKARGVTESDLSLYSKLIAFKVGPNNVIRQEGQTVNTFSKYDLNKDGRVNLLDFSMFAYWYKRTTVPKEVDFNYDSKVNLIDASMMAANWTG